MLTITSKSPYAVRALCELARRGESAPVPIGEIARRRDIPVQFLEGMFATLRRAGILQSQRGVKGGYSFARSPSEVTVLEIVELLEGGLAAKDAGEYALLCFLWWRAVRGRLTGDAGLALAFALAVAYGAVDEYHQTFVAGRNGSPIDVGIDAFGAALAVLAIRYRSERWGGRPSRAEPSERRPKRASA